MMRALTVILEPEDNGGYSVHCAAFPGCSSQGSTVEEAMDNIQEAIRGWLKVSQKSGMPIPEETPEIVAEEIKQILESRAEDGLPLTIETRIIKLPIEATV